MSERIIKVCDRCGKDMATTLDSGRINLHYSNSVYYGNDHQMDFCKDCIEEITPLLTKVLTDLFKVKDNDAEITDMNSFFHRESEMIEEQKRVEEQMKKYEEEQKKKEEEEANNKELEEKKEEE